MKAAVAAILLPFLAQLTHGAAPLQARDFHQRLGKRFGMKHMALDDEHLDIVGNKTFEQILDHSDPSKGTFSQRFWWNAEFYEEDGPIFLINGGEIAADYVMGYLQNTTLTGHYAYRLKGAVILLEHRYWGESVPFDTLTAETLQYHTLPNAVADMINFAQNVDCEFCEGGNFAAYHASSAVVEAIEDFWEYFTPIEAGLPRNCSADVKRVIRHIDTVLASNDTDDITTLKTRFGLAALEHDDFAHQLTYPLLEWQEDQQPTLDFCNAIESAGANYTKHTANSGYGVSLVAALDAYAAYVKKTSKCGEDSARCNTHNPALVWNTPDEKVNRPWEWMICNESFGWNQVGPPESDGTNIVSSFLRPDYFERRCPLEFPETAGVKTGEALGFTPEHLNLFTGGWDAPYEKVIFVNGRVDPWRSATVASDTRPGGPIIAGTGAAAPTFVVEDGDHCPELEIDEGDPSTWPIVQESVKIMGGWLAEWTPAGKAGRRRRG
ncbi:Uu.00g018530.m01.CDS01 [Anthostomella pinea]|uniref:Uu.00g018530.m01.CDS01 n=1 Tax=Anthostomella pinea TaxID=933095 RepID=A0AAI8VZ38_9PEZI|nr:Uu.00g018530.m01.CDS01 [Anthostomella pinea]